MRNRIRKFLPIDVPEILLWIILIDLLVVELFPRIIVHAYPRF
jgi:hypothetical protein